MIFYKNDQTKYTGEKRVSSTNGTGNIGHGHEEE